MSDTWLKTMESSMISLDKEEEDQRWSQSLCYSNYEPKFMIEEIVAAEEPDNKARLALLQLIAIEGEVGDHQESKCRNCPPDR